MSHRGSIFSELQNRTRKEGGCLLYQKSERGRCPLQQSSNSVRALAKAKIFPVFVRVPPDNASQTCLPETFRYQSTLRRRRAQTGFGPKSRCCSHNFACQLAAAGTVIAPLATTWHCKRPSNGVSNTKKPPLFGFLLPWVPLAGQLGSNTNLDGFHSLLDYGLPFFGLGQFGFPHYVLPQHSR